MGVSTKGPYPGEVWQAAKKLKRGQLQKKGTQKKSQKKTFVKLALKKKLGNQRSCRLGARGAMTEGRPHLKGRP